MPPVVRGTNDVMMIEGSRRNQRILACRLYGSSVSAPPATLSIGPERVRSIPRWHGRMFASSRSATRSSCPDGLRDACWSSNSSSAKDTTLRNISPSFCRTHAASPCGTRFPLQQREQVRINQKTHLKGNRWRSGGTIGLGRRAKLAQQPDRAAALTGQAWVSE